MAWGAAHISPEPPAAPLTAPTRILPRGARSRSNLPSALAPQPTTAEAAASPALPPSPVPRPATSPGPLSLTHPSGTH